MASLAEDGEKLMASIADMADCMGASWAFWNYGLDTQMLTAEGEETKVVDHLVRTYAPKVAGRPILHVYDPVNQIFTLQFSKIPGVTGATEISIPERHYPQGWDLESSDKEGNWSSAWDSERRILSVVVDPSTEWHQLRISPSTPLYGRH